MAKKVLDVLNVDFDDPCLRGVDGIDLPALRVRMRREGAELALVWIDGHPVVLREPEPLRDRVKHG